MLILKWVLLEDENAVHLVTPPGLKKQKSISISQHTTTSQLGYVSRPWSQRKGVNRKHFATMQQTSCRFQTVLFTGCTPEAT